MKTIWIVYGTTANKFWGVCGLIMHSAICGASQKTMPCEGIVHSKLTAMSKVVNVQSEERSISLVARLRNDCFPKFLSRSFNENIKKSHLKGFFTLNPSHAQNVLVGVAGLLKGRLASFGIFVSKDNVVSPNFHFSLSMKRKKLCLSGMLKRMALREQESSEGLSDNSNAERMFDLGMITDIAQEKFTSMADYLKNGAEDCYSKIKNPEIQINEPTDNLTKTSNFIKYLEDYQKNFETLNREIDQNQTMLLDLSGNDNWDREIKNLKEMLNKSEEGKEESSELFERPDNILAKGVLKVRLHIDSSSEKYQEKTALDFARISSIFKVLQSEFIVLKKYLEETLISSYEKILSLGIEQEFERYCEAIDAFFSVESQRRLHPFFQEAQQARKLIENKMQFSESTRELSNQFLKLEKMYDEKKPLLMQCQEYLQTVDFVLNTQLDNKKLDNLQNSILIENLDNLVPMIQWAERISAFCKVATDSIASGRMRLLESLAEAIELNQDETTALCEKCRNYQKNQQIFLTVKQELSMIRPMKKLAPPSWDLQ